MTPGQNKRTVNKRTTASVRKQIQNAVNEMPMILTEPEASDLLRMQPQTLRNWRVKGEGPKHLKIGRSIRYRLEDILSWVERNVYRSTTEAFSAAELERRGFQ